MANETGVFAGFHTVFGTDDGFFKAADAAGQMVDQGAIGPDFPAGGAEFLTISAVAHGIAGGYHPAPFCAGAGGFSPGLRPADEIGLTLAGFRGPAGHVTPAPDRRVYAGFV